MSNQVGIAQEVLERLLVAKGLLSQIRDLPTTRPDRITLARQILTAHDAAELALAAIACHLGLLPTSRQTYLMEYFPAIQKHHPGREVAGRDYFGQLNQVRIDIKHLGIFPDPDQWKRVGERTWAYVSGWCQDYLSLPLDDVDESALIRILVSSNLTTVLLKPFTVMITRRSLNSWHSQPESFLIVTRLCGTSL